MHSPKKKFRVKLNDDTGRILHYGGNELADIQDILGKPAVNIFWEIAKLAGDSSSKEDRGMKLLQVVGDREILVLLHMGVRGGIGDSGGREFAMKEIGNLIHTDIGAKTAYLEAIVGALSIALFGKDPGTLTEAAAQKKKETPVAEEEKVLPNPTQDMIPPSGIGSS